MSFPKVANVIKAALVVDSPSSFRSCYDIRQAVSHLSHSMRNEANPAGESLREDHT